MTFKNNAGTVTKTVENSYDAQNQWIKRVVDTNGATSGGTEQTIFVYQDGQIVLQFDKSGSGDLDYGDLSHRYLWGPTVDMLLADEQIDWSDTYADGEILWMLTDHLGSVRDIVDNDGDLRQHNVYDSFGRLTDVDYYDGDQDPVAANSADAIDELFGYTGRPFDKFTGTQNNLHRIYEADTGTWLSQDPIGFAAGDANLTRYVGNIPTVFTDPSGEIWPVVIAIGLGGAWFFGNGGGNMAHAPSPDDLSSGRTDSIEQQFRHEQGLTNVQIIASVATAPLAGAAATCGRGAAAGYGFGRGGQAMAIAVTGGTTHKLATDGVMTIATISDPSPAGWPTYYHDPAGNLLDLGIYTGGWGIGGLLTKPAIARKYSNLPDPKNVGPYKEFTLKTQKMIAEQNKANNSGVNRSDQSGRLLTPGKQCAKGVPRSPDELNIDHIDPKSRGGTNSPANAQVLSFEENLAKGAKSPPNQKLFPIWRPLYIPRPDEDK